MPARTAWKEVPSGLELPLQGAGAGGQVAGDRGHGVVAGREHFQQRGADALDGAGGRMQVGQAAAEFGGEEPPHRLVLGEERAGGVLGGEGNGPDGLLAEAHAKIVSGQVRVRRWLRRD